MSHVRTCVSVSTTRDSSARTPSRRLAVLATGALLASLGAGHALAADAAPLELSLEEAVATAFRHSPRLKAELARVAEAEARTVGAGIYPHNPELEVQGAARHHPGGTTGDFEVGISQEFELAGQRRKRGDVADLELSAARSGRDSAERLVAAEVHLAFVDALEVAAMITVAEAEAELSRQLLDLSQRRFDAGAGTQLEVNVASAELGRAEQVVGALAGEYGAARAALAEAVGLPASRLPTPRGSLEAEAEALPDLEALLAAAEANRADLVALDGIERAAKARVALARAEGRPNLRAGIFVGREANTDTIIGAGLAIPLPFFQRNQGAVAEAQASVARAGAERDAARLSIAREVVSAYELYRAGTASLTTLRERVLGTTEENLELLRKAFEAGKTSWTDVLVMRRSLFDARRALVETSAQTRRARVRVDIAAGRLPLPNRSTGEKTQ